jgi:hypothetical protein
LHASDEEAAAFAGMDDRAAKSAVRDAKRALFEKYIGDMAWSAELGDFQFIGLEPESTWKDIPPARRQWLVDVCRGSSKPYKFLVTHFPPNPAEGPERRGADRGNLYEALDEAGILGYMHGHTHRIEAGRDRESGRLVFNSASAVFRDRGVMYFDVYGSQLVCFWRPVEGPARPLGVFDLEEARRAASQGAGAPATAE